MTNKQATIETIIRQMTIDAQDKGMLPDFTQLRREFKRMTLKEINTAYACYRAMNTRQPTREDIGNKYSSR